MIPERIRLSGFLSYRDEQEIDFSGRSFWMLFGDNGSGKSTVLDAITYALYGHHRGGTQNASELINKECSSLSVELEFQICDRSFQVRRSLKRTKSASVSGTQLILRTLDGTIWEPIEETHRKSDFDQWIQKEIGLNYETFTSSVMLLQGKAEKLLDSKPSGRAEVLANIVDLARYQNLHERANQKKLILKAQVESLQIQSESIPDVTDAEYAQAQELLELSDNNRRRAQDRLNELLSFQRMHLLWNEAESRLREARERLRSANDLIRSAPAIERDHTRWLDLHSALPAAHAVITTRIRLVESEQRTNRLQRQQNEAHSLRQQIAMELDQLQRQHDVIRSQIEKFQKETQTTADRLREMNGQLKMVHLIREHHNQLDILENELRLVPGDPAEDWKQSQKQREEWEFLERIRPILERFHQEREEYSQIQTRLASLTDTITKVRQQGELQKDHVEDQQRIQQQAVREREQAEQQLALALDQFKQKQTALHEMESVSGESKCRYCGQPLTPEHLSAERERRVQDLDHAQKVLAQRQQHFEYSQQEETRLTEHLQNQSLKLEQLRENYKDIDHERRACSNQIAKLKQSLVIAYRELPGDFSKRISTSIPTDWNETIYPNADAIQELSKLASQKDQIMDQYRETQKRYERWSILKANIRTLRDSIDRFTKTTAFEEQEILNQEYHLLLSQEISLQQSSKIAQNHRESIEDQIERTKRTDHEASTNQTALVGKLQTEEMTRLHCQELIDREMTRLQENWKEQVRVAGMSEYHEWKTEYDVLESREIATLYRKLELSRSQILSIEQDVARLEQEREKFPEDARLPDSVRSVQIADAQVILEQREREWSLAKNQLATFDHHRENRRMLDDKTRLIERDFRRHKTLTELLGRDRLQRHLVRQAETQIVDLANEFLGRLSNNQLVMFLNDTQDSFDRAFDLFCINRSLAETPIPVPFLSGSQKFRIALSLALGIGQYASEHSRPIECIMIDEGFSSLDQNGRSFMIEELQKLSGSLRRVILVSHDDLLESDPHDSYRFELQNGSTRVTRTTAPRIMP